MNRDLRLATLPAIGFILGLVITVAGVGNGLASWGWDLGFLLLTLALMAGGFALASRLGQAG